MIDRDRASRAKDLLQADNSAIFLPDGDGSTYRAIVALGDAARAVRAATSVQAGRTHRQPASRAASPCSSTTRCRPARRPGRGHDVSRRRAASWWCRWSRGEVDRRDRRLAHGRRPFDAARARVPADLRRPGHDRDRERAPVQRDQGRARAADRDRRDPARHQQLAGRRAAGVRGDRRSAADAVAAARRDVVRFDGELRALVGCDDGDPYASSCLRAPIPLPLGRSASSPAGPSSAEAIATCPTALAECPDVRSRRAAHGGWRTMLGAPMLRDGDAIGAIAVAARRAGPVPTSQIALLQTFADQAVIAIENVAAVQRDARSAAQGRAAHARAERGARLPGGDQRGAARHQRVADRRGAGVRGDPRLRDAPVRQRGRRRLPLRRRPGRAGRDAQLAATRRSRSRARSIRRRRARRMLAGRVILAGQALSVDDALLDPSYNHAFAQAAPGGAWPARRC